VNKGKKKSRGCYTPALKCDLSIPYCGLPLKVVSTLGFLFLAWPPLSADLPGPFFTQFLLLGTWLQLGSANAAPAPPNDIVSANISAAINNEMRLRI
jgi:hypothetical protein